MNGRQAGKGGDSAVVLRFPVNEECHCGVTSVKRLNVFSVFDLGSKIGTLNAALDSKSVRVMEMYGALNGAGLLLQALLKEDAFHSSRNEAEFLYGAIWRAMQSGLLPVRLTPA